jgi:hypothetical protein
VLDANKERPPTRVKFGQDWSKSLRTVETVAETHRRRRRPREERGTTKLTKEDPEVHEGIAFVGAFDERSALLLKDDRAIGYELRRLMERDEDSPRNTFSEVTSER